MGQLNSKRKVAPSDMPTSRRSVNSRGSIISRRSRKKRESSRSFSFKRSRSSRSSQPALKPTNFGAAFVPVAYVRWKQGTIASKEARLAKELLDHGPLPEDELHLVPLKIGSDVVNEECKQLSCRNCLECLPKLYSSDESSSAEYQDEFPDDDTKGTNKIKNKQQQQTSVLKSEALKNEDGLQKRRRKQLRRQNSIQITQAGCKNVIGEYEYDGKTEGVPKYKKGKETIHREEGVWYISENYNASGKWYYCNTVKSAHDAVIGFDGEQLGKWKLKPRVGKRPLPLLSNGVNSAAAAKLTFVGLYADPHDAQWPDNRRMLKQLATYLEKLQGWLLAVHEDDSKLPDKLREIPRNARAVPHPSKPPGHFADDGEWVQESDMPGRTMLNEFGEQLSTVDLVSMSLKEITTTLRHDTPDMQVLTRLCLALEERMPSSFWKIENSVNGEETFVREKSAFWYLQEKNKSKTADNDADNDADDDDDDDDDDDNDNDDDDDDDDDDDHDHDDEAEMECISFRELPDTLDDVKEHEETRKHGSFNKKWRTQMSEHWERKLWEQEMRWGGIQSSPVEIKPINMSDVVHRRTGVHMDNVDKVEFEHTVENRNILEWSAATNAEVCWTLAAIKRAYRKLLPYNNEQPKCKVCKKDVGCHATTTVQINRGAKQYQLARPIEYREPASMHHCPSGNKCPAILTGKQSSAFSDRVGFDADSTHCPHTNIRSIFPGQGRRIDVGVDETLTCDVGIFKSQLEMLHENEGYYAIKDRTTVHKSYGPWKPFAGHKKVLSNAVGARGKGSMRKLGKGGKAGDLSGGLKRYGIKGEINKIAGPRQIAIYHLKLTDNPFQNVSKSVFDMLCPAAIPWDKFSIPCGIDKTCTGCEDRLVPLSLRQPRIKCEAHDEFLIGPFVRDGHGCHDHGEVVDISDVDFIGIYFAGTEQEAWESFESTLAEAYSNETISLEIIYVPLVAQDHTRATSMPCLRYQESSSARTRRLLSHFRVKEEGGATLVMLDCRNKEMSCVINLNARRAIEHGAKCPWQQGQNWRCKGGSHFACHNCARPILKKLASGAQTDDDSVKEVALTTKMPRKSCVGMHRWQIHRGLDHDWADVEEATQDALNVLYANGTSQIGLEIAGFMYRTVDSLITA